MLAILWAAREPVGLLLLPLYPLWHCDRRCWKNIWRTRGKRWSHRL